MTQIAQQTFGAALLYIGAVLDKLGYRYQFWDEPTAAFDGTTFYFPKFPMELSEKALAYIWGYVYHEIGHALFSDFEAVKLANKIGGITEAVYLVFEDVWQESEYNKRTPYSRKRLSDLTAVMSSDNLLGPTPDSASPNKSLANFLLNYGYGEVLKHQPVDEFAKQDEIHLVNCFNQAVVDKVKAITLNLTECETSHEVLELAQMVTKAFVDEKPEPPQPPEPKQDSSDQSQSNQDNQSTGNSSNDGKSSQNDNQSSASNDSPQSNDDKSQNAKPENGEGKSDGSQDGKSDDKGSKANSDNSQTSKPQNGKDASDNANGTGNSNTQNNQDAKQETIKAFEDVLKASTSEFGKTERTDKIQSALSQSIKECGNPLPFVRPEEPLIGNSNWDEFVHRGEKSGTGLIPKFKRVFESQTRTRRVRQTKGRKLSRNFTLKMMTNDPRLFVQKHHKKGLNTHISVVLDDSISMKSNSKMEVSLDAIAAIGLAADVTKGVSLSACSFPGRNDFNSVEVLCRESESFKKVSGRFKPITASGCTTPMANGIIWAMEQCARSSNPRKIIIVITDGCPNSGHNSLVKQMVEKCNKHGVEIWGIGIKLEKVKDYFSDHMIINDVSELPHKLLNKITKTL